MDTPLPPLLEREEIMVLACVSNGMSTKEIAKELHFSEETVRRHMRVLQGKLRGKNWTHAVANAIRLKLIK